MKINLIENPRQELNAVKLSVPNLLSDKELSQITGGAVDCGRYTLCGKDGKNSCEPLECGTVGNCGQKSWALEEECPIEP